MKLDVKPLVPWQKRVYVDLKKEHNVVVVVGGRRIGKSELMLSLVHEMALSNPNSFIGIVYPSFTQSKNEIVEKLTRAVEQSPEYFHPKRAMNRNTYEWRYANGSRLKLFSLKNPNTLRGPRFDLVIMDEAQELSSADVVNRIILPTLMSFKGDGKTAIGKLLILGTAMGKNALYDLWQRGKTTQGWSSYRIPTTLKNCPHVTEESLSILKDGMDPIAVSRELDCSFDSYEGSIYSNFKRTIHVKNSIPNTGVAKAFIGFDVGWSHDSALVCVVQMTDGTFWIVDEWKVKRLMPEASASIIEAWIKKWHVTAVYVSPEQAHYIQDLRKQIKVVVKPANNEVISGISYVRSILHQDFSNPLKPRYAKLFLLSHCTETIKEFESYAYKEGSEQPLKVNDDLMDALRYALFSNSKNFTTSQGKGPNYWG